MDNSENRFILCSITNVQGCFISATFVERLSRKQHLHRHTKNVHWRRSPHTINRYRQWIIRYEYRRLNGGGKVEAVFLCICRMGGLDTGIMNGSLVVKTYMCNAESNFNKL